LSAFDGGLRKPLMAAHALRGTRKIGIGWPDAGA
jgi:hypothetical protein